MGGMANGPDWGKRGVIAAWVLGISTIALAILAYVKPPDPAHPMKLDFLSQSIAITPWFAALIVLVIIAATVIITRKLAPKAVPPPVVQTLPSPSTIDTTALFEIHVPTLDDRPTPDKETRCPAKLRFSLKNISNQPIHVDPLKWVTGMGNISLQCGAAPWPGREYKPDMQEIGFFYQLEKYQGSWKKNEWQMKGKDNSEHDERKDILVAPGSTFRIWIGMNPCVPERILKERLKVNQLGTLILPLLVNGKTCEWITEF
jgi:hypothetical protein